MNRPLVLKVSGSLLTERGGIERLQAWLTQHATQEERTTRILLLGGGEPVETLRRIDAANPLPAAVTHRAAIDQLDQNAKLLSEWLTEWQGTQDPSQLGEGNCIFAPGHFLRHVEPGLPGTRLPVGWHVTSDSIACRLAICIRADLLLVKRVPPPSSLSAWEQNERTDWASLANASYVDPFFPKLVGEAPWVRISVAS